MLCITPLPRLSTTLKQFANLVVFGLLMIGVQNSAKATNEPFCYTRANTSFDQIAAQPVLSTSVKVTSYASAGTSLVFIAPTLAGSLPLGLLASAGSLAVADLSQQIHLGERERFMAIVLEAMAYKALQNTGVKPDVNNFPVMKALNKRVNGFLNKPQNLDLIADTINQLNTDPDFCNDGNNMRFVHLKDRVLNQGKTDS